MNAYSLRENLPRFHLNGPSGLLRLKQGSTKSTFNGLKDR